jgi:transcription initiation factor TFIIIB Brf1 subunit/transcription initiation factor TFIIB
MEYCEDCGGQIYEDFLKGLFYCSKCSLVIDFKTYTTEAEGYNNEGSNRESTERTGNITNLIFNKDYLVNDIDVKNMNVSLQKRFDFDKLKFWHKRITNIEVNEKDKEKNKIILILNQVSSGLKLSRDFQKNVVKVHDQIKGKIDKMNLKILICSIVYYLSKKENSSLSFNEIVSNFNVTRKNVSKSYRVIATKLEILSEDSISSHLKKDLSLLINSAEKRQKLLEECEEVYQKGLSIFNFKVPAKMSKMIVSHLLVYKELKTIKECSKAFKIGESTLFGSNSELIKNFFDKLQEENYSLK